MAKTTTKNTTRERGSALRSSRPSADESQVSVDEGEQENVIKWEAPENNAYNVDVDDGSEGMSEPMVTIAAEDAKKNPHSWNLKKAIAFSVMLVLGVGTVAIFHLPPVVMPLHLGPAGHDMAATSLAQQVENIGATAMYAQSSNGHASSHHKMGGGAIAGIIIVACVALGGLIWAIFCCCNGGAGCGDHYDLAGNDFWIKNGCCRDTPKVTTSACSC